LQLRKAVRCIANSSRNLSPYFILLINFVAPCSCRDKGISKFEGKSSTGHPYLYASDLDLFMGKRRSLQKKGAHFAPESNRSIGSRSLSTLSHWRVFETGDEMAVKRETKRGKPACLSLEYICTNRQLGNPSRSRCRRCLRILAIFRPAASDKAARFFFLLPALYRYASISHLFPGEKAKREGLRNGLRTAWRMENEFAWLVSS